MKGVVQGQLSGAKLKSVQFASTGAGTTVGGYVDVAINAVDTSKAIVIPLTQGGTTTDAPSYYMRALELVNSTTVRVYGAYYEIAFMVLEFSGNVTVQRGTAVMSSSLDTVAVTVSSVDTSRSFAIATGYTVVATTTIYAKKHNVYGRLTSATNLQITKIQGGTTRAAMTCPWQVITIG